jgi:hypothetical protein
MSQETSKRFLAVLDLEGYCPGFRLWEVEANDGQTYLVDADYEGSADTRMFFGSNGKIRLVSAKCIGENPDAIEWKKARGMND